MNYIILDLEATYWKDRNTNKQNEIIEIGTLKMHQNGTLKSEFSEFVKPQINPELSDFCKELTTIEQSDIDNAKTYDLYKLEKNWLTNHISLKHQYAEIKNLRKPLGMGRALKRVGLKLDGTHHRGIDDARNIAKIFKANIENLNIENKV